MRNNMSQSTLILPVQLLWLPTVLQYSLSHLVQSDSNTLKAIQTIQHAPLVKEVYCHSIIVLNTARCFQFPPSQTSTLSSKIIPGIEHAFPGDCLGFRKI